MTFTRKEFLAASAHAALGAVVGPSTFDFLDLPRTFLGDVLQTPQVAKIHKYIEDHKTQHIARVQRDLRQPSVSSWNRGMSEMADLMVASFREIGCREASLVKTDGYPGVWAWYDGGARKTIARYMMYDTQPFEEQQWSSPPLAANLVPMGPFPQVIVARGAFNDKGLNRFFLNACEAILAVEGKATESFGLPVRSWVRGDLQQPAADVEPRPSRVQRLEYLAKRLGIAADVDSPLYYQLLHRTVSAVMEAALHGAVCSVLLVHCFADTDDLNFRAYQAFLAALGADGAKKGQLVGPLSVSGGEGIPLYALWFQDKPHSPAT